MLISTTLPPLHADQFTSHSNKCNISTTTINPFSTGTHFVFILFITSRFYTASETHIYIKILQTLAINLLTSIDAF